MGAVTRERFAREVLRRLGVPETHDNLVAMVAWMAAENTAATWNPLATTMSWPGAQPFNAAGVKSYVTLDDGLAATVATLRLRHYRRIVEALARSAPPRETLREVAVSPWGTGQAAERALRPTVESWPRAALVPVRGPDPEEGDVYDHNADLRDQQTHDAVARIEDMLANHVLAVLRSIEDRLDRLEQR